MAKTHRKNLIIEGMTCTNCALGVQRIIEKNGGKNAYVNFSTNEAKFDSEDTEKDEAIIQFINKSGYKVVQDISPEKFSTVEKLFVFCLIFTLPLFMHMFAGHDSFLNDPIFQICMTVPVVLSGGVFFFKSAIGSLKIGVPNMDVLVSIGILSAFIYSVWGVYINWGNADMHNFLFFETAATVTTLVLLGNVIEHRSVMQTTSALSELNSLQAETAKKIVDGKIVECPVVDLKIGDIVQINDGDTFPLDGKVESGEFDVDEGMITGESQPVFKSNSSPIIGGTLNVSGNGNISIISIKGQSTLDKIITLVKDAQESKPDIQKLGDRISAIFVPIVLGISLLTFLISYFLVDISFQQSLMQSIAVLVISCPCAMGLAAPTAVIVGVGKAAKKGILIKGGQTLEKIAQSKIIVFDKTGTLTTGKFVINELKCDQDKEQEVKTAVATLTSKSSHPISKSLFQILEKETSLANYSNIEEIKGKGLIGTDEQNNTWELLSSSSSNTSSSSDLSLFQNKKLIAEIWISDEVKPGVKESVQWLVKNDIQPVMLSGDKKEKCSKVAQQLGINTFYGEKTPEDKLEIIEQLNQKENTIMVGDGVNDAPALAKSHVGISFGAATNSAIHSADIVLMNENFNTILSAIEISQLTYKTIKQNFFWAFAYNTLAIPIAAFGFLKPMIAALSMALSDVIVIGNSVLLRFKGKK